MLTDFIKKKITLKKGIASLMVILNNNCQKEKFLKSGWQCCINRTNFRKLNLCVFTTRTMLAFNWLRANFSKGNHLNGRFRKGKILLNPDIIFWQGGNLAIIRVYLQLQTQRNDYKERVLNMNKVPSESPHHKFSDDANHYLYMKFYIP